MYNSEEFRKFATKEKGISSLKLDQFQSAYANYISPTIIEERQMNIASMDVFSRLMMDRIIFLGVPINDYVANIIQAQLLFLESVDSKKDIQIYLNSPGGSVYAGLGIYDTMQYINPKISTLCVGQAASMGSLLLSAGEPGMRFSLPNSRIMVHQPSGGFQGQASDIALQAKEILELKKRLNLIYVKHCKQKLEKVESALDRDNFMTPDEAKKWGIIDEILTERVIKDD